MNFLRKAGARLYAEGRYVVKPLFGTSEQVNIPSTPHLPSSLLDYYRNSLAKNGGVIEYGCGSSTLFFADLTGSVVSVESDLSWASSVDQVSERRGLGERVVILYRGLGPSGEWGFPIYNSGGVLARYRSRRYVRAPWFRFSPQELSSVLIDGRLRVACAAFTAIQILTSGRSFSVVFDDFLSRDYYHCVLSLFEIEQELGDAAVLRISSRASVLAASELMDRYILDPR